MKVQGNIPQIVQGIQGKLVLHNNGIIQISNDVIFNSRNPIAIQGTYCKIIVGKAGKLTIGKSCGFSHCTIYATNSITIGEHVFLGANCNIYDTNFHSLNYEDRISSPDLDIKSAPVKIDDGAFLGTRVIVLKGTTIGKRAVIGAGSVVHGTIGDDEVWAGNPARFIKKIEQRSSPHETHTDF